VGNLGGCLPDTRVVDEWGTKTSANTHVRLGIPEDYGRATGLPFQAEAKELVSIGSSPDGRDLKLTPAAARAWSVMREAAASAGIVLVPLSCFRSVERQTALIEAKLLKGELIRDILTTVAAPGFSEHHTGNAVDIAVPDAPALTEAFAETSAFAWLSTHAKAHGFRLSYPKGNPHGFVFEPWHWFFVGQT